jgi:drug/metabolite transporter (DMT)-like permease
VLLIVLSFLWGGSFFFIERALTGLPVWSRVALAAVILGTAFHLTGGPSAARAGDPGGAGGDGRVE